MGCAAPHCLSRGEALHCLSRMPRWSLQCSEAHLASCSLDVFGGRGTSCAQQEVQAHHKRRQQPQDGAEGAIQPCNMLTTSLWISVQGSGRFTGVLPPPDLLRLD